MMRCLVAGAGGLIGHALVKRLKRSGHFVRGVDLKLPPFEPSSADEFLILDLKSMRNCRRAALGMERIYNLAADMGGMGFIAHAHVQALRNNVLIDVNMLEAARLQDVERYFWASSACIYPDHLQDRPDAPPLREQDAYPAAPQGGYGLEKLYGEALCRYYREQYRVPTRLGRIHNCYGEPETWYGGREKAPAAIARKVAVAKLAGFDFVEIWGGGTASRTYCYIDDCLEMIDRLVNSEVVEPVNIGSDQPITVDGLVHLTAKIAGCTNLKIVHVDGPVGVAGRSSDNTLARSRLNWVPATSIQAGMSKLYPWVESKVRERLMAGVYPMPLMRGIW